MKVFLLFKDRDFDLETPLPANEQDLVQDLELDVLLKTMASGDEYLYQAAKTVLLNGLQDAEAIRYRQEVLKDALKNPSVVRELYRLAEEALDRKKRGWYGIYGHFPSSVLHGSLEMVQMLTELLKKLKDIADQQVDQFNSEGFVSFFRRLQQELHEAYLAEIADHLKALRFQDGILISAALGRGNEGTDYLLRKPLESRKGWLKRIFPSKGACYSFSIHPRDEAGVKALENLRNRGIGKVANVLAQSADHLDGFFKRLRAELAFYVGALNLYEELVRLGGAVCFPQPAPPKERKHSAQGLYDIGLFLTMRDTVVGNDFEADGKDCVVITGANQGGKSTFLRSIGLAQLMMQSGLFVPAASFRADCSRGIFTHFKREEDLTLKRGKLDEELSRMSKMVDLLRPHALMLFNESFAATNEREGSEIARQISAALLEKGVKIFYVTHQYAFAHWVYENRKEKTLFLRAERKDDGTRTFRLIEGPPLPTSHGEDLYGKLFGPEH